MKKNTFKSSEFVNILKQEYGLHDVEKSALRYYEDEGLLYPERNEHGHRIYHERDIVEVIKIKLLTDFIGISIKNMRKILGSAQMGEKCNPEFLWELLINPQLRKFDGDYGSLSQKEKLSDMLVEQFASMRNKYPDEWYEQVDWQAMYEQSKSFIPQDERIANQIKMDQFIQEIKAKINIAQLLEEVAEQIKEDAYESAVDIIMDEYELDDFDENHAEPHLLQAFNEEIAEWIDQYEEEVVIEKIEEFLDLEIQEELQKIEKTHDWVTAALRAKLIDELARLYKERRAGYVNEFSELYDFERRILGPADMELLSVLFYGVISIWHFSFILVEDERYSSYIHENYAKVRGFNKYLHDKFKDYMQVVPSLYNIPGRESTVLKEAKEYGIPIIYTY